MCVRVVSEKAVHRRHVDPSVNLGDVVVVIDDKPLAAVEIIYTDHAAQVVAKPQAVDTVAPV